MCNTLLLLTNFLILFFSITRHEALTSSRELSYVFHKLNQIYLVEKFEENNHILGLILALNSVNLAEAAGTMMPCSDLCDIYVNMALRIKHSCIFQSIHRFYLGLAKQASTNSCDQIPLKLQWVFTQPGYRFFISQKLTYEVEVLGLPFASLGNKADPMSFILKVVYESM